MVVKGKITAWYLTDTHKYVYIDNLPYPLAHTPTKYYTPGEREHAIGQLTELVVDADGYGRFFTAQFPDGPRIEPA